MNKQRIKEALALLDPTAEAAKILREELREPEFVKGQWVLCRDNDDEEWILSIYSHYDADSNFPYRGKDSVGFVKYKQCKPLVDYPGIYIPYTGITKPEGLDGEKEVVRFRREGPASWAWVMAKHVEWHDSTAGYMVKPE